MANKPLKSIKFPNLPDTYTVPQVDATLTTQGAAADAKAVGDALSDLSVETDKTLSVADKPADAKKVGDEISDIKADLDENINDLKSAINTITEVQNLFNGNTHSGIHSQTNGAAYGTASANENYFYTDLIPIDNKDMVCVYLSFTNTTTAFVTFFDINQKVVGMANGYNLNITNFPSNAVSFCVCAHINMLPTLVISNKIPDDYYEPLSIAVTAENLLGKNPVRLDRGFSRGFVPKKTNAGQSPWPLSANANIGTSYPVPIDPTKVVSYVANTQNYAYVLYIGLDGLIIGHEGFTPYSKGTLTIPTNTAYFLWYVNLSNNFNPETDMTFAYGTDISVYSYDNFRLSGLLVENDPLSGKSIVFDGDSITEGAGVTDITTGISPNNNKGWGYWIQRMHAGAKCYGFGKSGWCVGRRDGADDSLLNHIAQYPDTVDLFVLSGGYNDQARQMAMGEIVEATDGSNSYYNAVFDQYTFIGALEYWFQQLRIKYPTAQIVYVLTPKRIYTTDPVFNNDTKGERVRDVLYSTGFQRMAKFWEAIKTVCDKWAIRYLDLSQIAGVVGSGEVTDTGLTVNSRYFQITNSVPDMTHPNTLCYKTFLVPQIDALIKDVMPYDE